MPYSSICWIKLKLDLLTDYRFTDKCDDGEKLLFIGLLLLAGQTENKIPKNPVWIKRILNLNKSPEDINRGIEKLLDIFPGLVGNSDHLRFKNFEEFHNWLGNSKGTPSELQRLSQIKIKTKIKKKTKREEYIPTYNTILAHWNGLKIIQHKQIPDDRTYGYINTRLDHGYTLEEIIQSMDNYSHILNGKKYWWNYKWTLAEFMKRGLDKFMDLEVAKKNNLDSKYRDTDEQVDAVKKKFRR